ncbi:MAG: hypothetical protein ACJ77K_11535 [Bacteroidia bacterium]
MDNLFWDNEPGNKKQPVTFRPVAAFSVKSPAILSYNVEFATIDDPVREIKGLLELIQEKVNEHSATVKDEPGYLHALLADEEQNSDSVITTHIHLGQPEKALQKIKEYRSKQVKSRFRFEDSRGYHDWAEEFINKMTPKS